MFSRRSAGWWLLGVLVGLWLLGHGGDGHADDRADPGAAGATTTPASPRPSVAASRPPVRPAAASTKAPRPGSALAVLDGLRVKGRAPMTGYSRGEFGQAWLDADRNGCDTRNDILRRDVTDPVVEPGTSGCVVLRGVLHDPYLGRTVAFARGAGDQVDIDHVVALGNAWATGAARFDIHVRAALANDPLNLLAVDLHSNRAKGDGDAATWLPSYKPFRCAYVARQVAVKHKYGLWVTPPERAAMVRVLDTCPGERLPADPTHAPTSVDQHITDPTAAATPRPLAGGTTYYANCDAVRAAGAAPILAGQPGYSRRLDRDGDGVGCE